MIIVWGNMGTTFFFMPMPCNEIKVCQNIFFLNIITFTIEDSKSVHCFNHLAKRKLIS